MTSRQSRFGVLVGIALISLPLLTAPASGSPVDDKKREAARVQVELDAQGERISILDEQYNRARLRVEETDSTLARSQLDLAAANTKFRSSRTRLARHAVDAYVHGGSSSLLDQLAQSRGPDLPVRQHYLRVTAAKERSAIDDLRAAREDLTKLREQNQEAQSDARAAANVLKSHRSDIERAVTAQRSTLSRVNGELAQLVAAEEARKAAEAARRAQAALAARQAAERAQRTTGGRTTAPAPRQGSKPKPPPASAPPVGQGAAAAVAEARRQIGKPYVWAAAGPDSFDCSGLTQWAWRVGGVRLSHSTYTQWDETPHIPISALQPGDLVYFGDDLHHMAIYSGGGMMIEAPYTGTTVRERPLRTKDLVGATRPG